MLWFSVADGKTPLWRSSVFLGARCGRFFAYDVRPTTYGEGIHRCSASRLS